MKHILTYEEFLNEAKVDIRLATHEEPKGVMARFRLSSTTVNLRTVVNLSKDPSVKFCTVFGPDEIGFEDSTSRKKAMEFIQKSFDSGKLKLTEYELNQAKGKTPKGYTENNKKRPDIKGSYDVIYSDGSEGNEVWDGHSWKVWPHPVAYWKPIK